MNRKIRKYRREGLPIGLINLEIWLPRNKSSKRGGNLLWRVYKKLRRGKGYTRADLTGITVDGRQLY